MQLRLHDDGGGGGGGLKVPHVVIMGNLFLFVLNEYRK
jgi:hypothetical protein